VIERSAAEPGAFAMIFERHYTVIHRYLHRRVGSSLADDLASETFTLAFRQRARYDSHWESAKPWLFGISVNLLRRYRRTERRQLLAYARTGVDSVHHDGLDTVEARVDAGALGPLLARSLASLRPDDREVLLLHAWAELTYEQIGNALGIPIGTVRSRLSRGRRRLRELLSLSGQVADREPELAKEDDHG